MIAVDIASESRGAVFGFMGRSGRLRAGINDPLPTSCARTCGICRVNAGGIIVGAAAGVGAGACISE